MDIPKDGLESSRSRTSNGQAPEVASNTASRFWLVVFCLAAAMTYRASVSLVPPGIPEAAFVLVLAAFFLVLALVARRRPRLSSYWQIPFAFFVFAVAGLFGDGSISPLQRLYVTAVLHETVTADNPLASSPLGSVLAQLVGTLLLTVPIIVLTKVSGNDLSSIFLGLRSKWWGLGVGALCFVLIYFLAARGRTESFFPTHGAVTPSRLLTLTPALVVLVLLNGFREELWFRGLFLNKYGRFLGPLTSNVLAAVIFTAFHVQVRYSASITLFLGYTLVLGLILGWLMQRTGSLWASAIFHAGTDIPIFLVYLSFAST
jgi:membrane protease YdiL (CAAX protease family)